MSPHAPRTALRFFPVVSLVVLAAAPAGAALTHRYSFNDGTANDSVGNANGVAVNNPQITGGRVNLANNGFISDWSFGQYIDLPNQIARTPSLTLETWATYRGGSVFQEIASLGTGSLGEILPGATEPVTGGQYGTEYVAIIPHFPHNQQNGLGGTIRGGNVIEQAAIAPAPLPTSGEHHVAYVVDYPNRTSALYLDGAEVARLAISLDPSQFDQVNDWLGRSQWPDPFFNGSINEFRIYDRALTPAEVAASFAAGPDGLPEPAALATMAFAAPLLLRRRHSEAR